MTTLRCILAACCLALVAPAVAQEDTAYVTDILRLGLHQAEDTSDRAFRSLESGQEMAVLERNSLYARVRLPDGTEGWVKAGFLVAEPPARLIVDQALAQRDAAQAELAQVRDTFSGAAGELAALEQRAVTAESALAESRAEVQAAETQLGGLQQRLDTYGFSLPLPIAVGGMLVMLVLGFVGGFWWIDSRSRKRHGGFRIY